MKSNSGSVLTATAYQNILNELTSHFKSFSILNKDGQLLFSKDEHTDYLTTSRLVAFQIVNKYLQPKINDLFLLNDPENGGFHFSQLIFVAALSDHLFLVWNEENNLIDFKIPATPLFEKGVKNEFVWKALIENHLQSKVLKAFFENEKNKLRDVLLLKDQIQILSLPRHQMIWFKATQEIFEHQFSSKAHGSYETTYKYSDHELIKLKVSAEEKQNIKMITLDFTSTSQAAHFHAASHVVESGLIQKLIQFYQVENYFSQSVLDKIKVILPPKSIVSKAHPKGDWNSDIQSICSQLCGHNLEQMNSQKRKPLLNFNLDAKLKFELKSPQKNYIFNFSPKLIELNDFEDLIHSQHIDLLKVQRQDQHILLHFKLKPLVSFHIKIFSQIKSHADDFYFKINNSVFQKRDAELKSQDEIEIKWKLN